MDRIFKVNFILLWEEGSVLQKHILMFSCSPDVCVPLTEKLLDEAFKAFILQIQAQVRKSVFNLETVPLETGPAEYSA